MEVYREHHLVKTCMMSESAGVRHAYNHLTSMDVADMKLLQSP